MVRFPPKGASPRPNERDTIGTLLTFGRVCWASGEAKGLAVKGRPFFRSKKESTVMATAKKQPKDKKPTAQFEGKRPPGRPRTTIAALPPDWEEKIRELAQQGAGRIEWQCALGIHNHAYLTLLEDSAEFRAVILQAKLLCQAWWEQLGRRGAAGLVEVNASIWAFNMKNRFKWRDATVTEARGELAGSGQPKTLVRNVLPAVKHQLSKFDAPGSQGVVED